MRVLFVASGNSQTGITQLVKRQGASLKINGITITYYPIKGKGFYNYLMNIKALKSHLKINQYDVIHAHYGLCGIISYLARTEEKLVVSFMGDDLIGEINKKEKWSIQHIWRYTGPIEQIIFKEI